MDDTKMIMLIYGVFVALAWYSSTQYDKLKALKGKHWFSFVFLMPATVIVVALWGAGGLLVGLLGIGLFYLIASITSPDGANSNSNEQHIRGGELLDARDKEYLSQRKKAIEKKTGRTVTTIGGVPITKKDETLNMLFSGSPGSGKTQAFHEVIEAVLVRGERAIIFDESGDFVSKHSREGDLLFNPFDARTIGWSIMNEVKSVENCANLANAMIPDGTNSTENQWNSYARGIIQVVLESMFKAGTTKNSTLFEWVMLRKVSELKELCQGTPAQRAFEEGSERMVSNILTIMASCIAPWRDVPDGEFSIRDYIENEAKYKSKFLFLASDSNRLKAIAPIYLAMINLAVVAVNSLPANDDRRLWFFLDELPALGALNELDALLNRARKRGAAAVIGLQSLKYFDKLHGQASTALILSGIGTSLILRTNDEISAKDLAAQLGKQDVLRAVVSESQGLTATGASNSKSTNYQTKEGAELVTATELTRLPSRVGYLKRAGEGREILLVDIPICYKEGKFPAFVAKPTEAEQKAIDDKAWDEMKAREEIEIAQENAETEKQLAEMLKKQELEKQKAKDKELKPDLVNEKQMANWVEQPVVKELDMLGSSLADLVAINAPHLINQIVVGATVHAEMHYENTNDFSLELEHNKQSENDGHGSSFTGSPDNDR